MDAEQRDIHDPNYDPQTLYIDPDILKHDTPLFQQYFIAKKDQYDKILFFRYGRMYMLLYHDAFVMQQHCNCQVRLWGKRPHVSIQDNELPLYKSQLLRKGFKIAICDQIESLSFPDKDLMHREIVQIISAGTAIEGEADAN